ncbi:peroxiredoxin [Candidatus Gracilibacteria bacterium]|nr:peroxiredoxin [Thermales bacterium]NJL96370.1 peroxiredoxin [Candidatus Gracilibacteria bacterium]NJS41830.1 peroxiredoxin [Candidatus Gracilibacteria bacterium]
MQIPNVTFKTRVKNNNGEFEWKDVSSSEIFDNKKIVVFALPGAFTPTCSSTHLPGYEEKYDTLKKLGVDEVYCLSVNDAYVMNAWAKVQDIENIKMLPDGNTEFTKAMGMLVKKENLGFGNRSWRYSMLVNNGEVQKIFTEAGKSDNSDPDPLEVSDVNTMIEYIKSNQ